MKLRSLLILSIAVAATACSSTPKKMAYDAAPGHPSRTFASEKDFSIDLKNIYSMQRSFWSDKRDGKEYYGSFSAFVFKDQMNEEGNARLVIYIDNPENFGEMKAIVDNNKFIWSGTMAGTEPSLAVNRKNSLLIQTGNDGIGRSAWHETVTARILASSGRIEVIGYDYDDYDKLQEDDAHTCSYNFLTGQATSTVTNAKTEKTVVRKVKGIKKTIDLNDWSESSKPADCMPQ